MENVTTQEGLMQGVSRATPLYIDSLEPDYLLYRMDGGETRWYYRPDTGRWYPSVTSVISATTPTPYGLLQWMKKNGDNADAMRDERAEYGTWLHIQIAGLLIQGEYDLDTLPSNARSAAVIAGGDPDQWETDGAKDLLAFAAFARTHSVRPIAVECVLCSEDGYAGAIDLVCTMRIGTGQNGAFLQRDKGGQEITAIVDMKSGRKGFYESHEIQLHMYRRLWDENFPGIPVDKVFNFSPKDWRTAPSWNLRDQTSSESAAKIPHLVELFRMSGEDGPSPRLRVSGKITPSCDLSDLYRYEDIQEELRKSLSQ